MKRKGFTLIELLVVIAIIGLLATIAAVALNNARTSSRDTKRLADIRQVQTGLELYFNAQTTYPYDALALCGDGGPIAVNTIDTICITGGGDIKDYLGGIDNIKDPKGTTACTAASAAVCDYSYKDNGADGTTYTMYFYLEEATGNLALGVHTATPAGIQ